MNRRDLMRLAAAQAAIGAFTAAAVASPATAEAKEATASLALQNAQFGLSLTPGSGLGCKLVHLPTGAVLADGFYSYSFGPPTFFKVENDGRSALLRGSTESGMEIRHRFTVDPECPWIEEQLEFINSGSTPLDLHSARCGFVLPISLEGEQAQGPWAQYKVTAIPFRREPNGHKLQYADFPLDKILTGHYSSELWTMKTTVTPYPFRHRY